MTFALVSASLFCAFYIKALAALLANALAFVGILNPFAVNYSVLCNCVGFKAPRCGEFLVLKPTAEGVACLYRILGLGYKIAVLNLLSGNADSVACNEINRKFLFRRAELVDYALEEITGCERQSHSQSQY